MIREMLFPCLVLVPLLVAGCSSESGSKPIPNSAAPTPNVAVEHPAAAVANAVLAAIQDGDAKAIQSFFNESNRNNIGEEQFIELVEVARQIAGDSREIIELRHGDREGVVVAKIRNQADKAHVLVLEIENGEYRLEDINTPLLTDYGNLKMVQ